MLLSDIMKRSLLNYQVTFFRAWFQGIDLNQGDYDNRTPLHLASAEGHIECVNFLLKLAKVFPKPLDR